jgi:hypothetical protein
MPDIAQPETVRIVERRLEGRSQGGGGGGKPGLEQPAKKVAATYEEADKVKPADDRITILGIPVEQITPATRAALGGLVAEINFLRGMVKRHERAGSHRSEPQGAMVLDPETFVKALGGTLTASAPEGAGWVLVLVHVQTYEDIRRSSGLLAANGVLADVAQRLADFRMDATLDVPAGTMTGMAATFANSFSVLGYAGGSSLAALTTLASDYDAGNLARAVRAHLTASGYVVGGIEMALVIKTAAAVIGAGESATLALGRADHLLRAG